MPDDSLPPGDKTVLVFFETIAFALGWNGIDRLLTQGTRLSAIPIMVASVATSYVGFRWPQIKTKIGGRFASVAERITADRLFRSLIYTVMTVVVAATLGTAIYRHRKHLPTAAQPTASCIRVSEVIIGTEVGSSERMVVQETRKTLAGSTWIANIYFSNEGPATVRLHVYSTSSFITVDMANPETRTIAENMEWDRTVNLARYPVGMRTITTPPHQSLVTSPTLAYHVGVDDLRKIQDYKAAVYFMARFSYMVGTQELNSDVCVFRTGNSPLVHQCSSHNSQ